MKVGVHAAELRTSSSISCDVASSSVMNRSPNSLVPAPPKLPTLERSEQTVTNVLPPDQGTASGGQKASPKRNLPAPPRSRREVPPKNASTEELTVDNKLLLVAARGQPPPPNAEAATGPSTNDGAPSPRNPRPPEASGQNGSPRPVTQPFPALVNERTPSIEPTDERRSTGPGLFASMLPSGFGDVVQDVLRSTANAAPRVTPPGLTGSSHDEASGFKGARRARRISVLDRSFAALRSTPPRSPLALAITAAVGLAVLSASFVLGRASRAPSLSPAKAHHAWTAVSWYARAHASENARAHASSSALRPCLMQAAPSRWASVAARSIPMELLSSPSGELAVGFARDERTPRGVLLDLAIGVVARSHEPTESVEGLSRVTPLADGTDVRFASVGAEQDGLSQPTYLRAKQPMVVGVVDGSLALKATPEGSPVTLWSLPGEIQRLQVAPIGPNAVGGFGVTYVSAERVWFGIAKTDGSIIRQAAPLESESRVGRPMLASDGREVSIVYAEGEPGNVPVRVRWARISASSGSEGVDVKVPFVELPPGGPGGDAIAPDVASLPDGRWLLLWTEGTSGERALRAQTFDAAGQTLGPALRVSPETGNFGQGTVSAVGGRAAVAFLMKSDTYQLWGTVLQCG